MIGKMLIAAALIAAPSVAQATDVSAIGSGWCNSGGGCNSDATYINNTYANDADGFRDFFKFSLPAGTIGSASLSIWNDGYNYSDASGVYDLHAAAGFSFGDLGAGAVLGSIPLSVADTGQSHYVTIALNAAGIAALNGAGGTFLFGGVAHNGYTQFAGYTNGSPAAYLTVEASSPAPEPASWAMMLGGFGAVGGAMRARRRTAVSFA